MGLPPLMVQICLITPKVTKIEHATLGGNFYPNALEFVNNATAKTQTWNVYQKQWPTFDAWAQKKKRKKMTLLRCSHNHKILPTSAI